MRTYKFSNDQVTFLVDTIADSIADSQDNMTIHDIKVLNGDWEGIVSAGFKFRIPDVVNRQELIKLAKDRNFSLSISDGSTETSLVTAPVFAFVVDGDDDDDDDAGATIEMEATVGERFYESIEVENACGGVRFTTEDDLPDGLILNELGAVVGIPTEAHDDDDETEIEVTATDSTGQEITATIIITVVEADDDDAS